MSDDVFEQLLMLKTGQAGDGSGHTPLTPEWTPAPRASHYPWQGDRPAVDPSLQLSSRLLLVNDSFMLVQIVAEWKH